MIPDINKFTLSNDIIQIIKNEPYSFGFDGMGEMIYYRTYSRTVNEKQEHWPDTVIRVVNGIMSILKNHRIEHKLGWEESYWQNYCKDFALYMLKMRWLPPGRGLWACGSDFMYEKGSAALYNCAFTNMINLRESVTWLMDALMCGCGVGIDIKTETEIIRPSDSIKNYIIEDSREGWVASISELLKAYTEEGTCMPIFDYSKIRKQGKRLKTFGGTASGPDPLIKLHERLHAYLQTYLNYIEGRDVFENYVNLLWEVDKDNLTDANGNNFKNKEELLAKMDKNKTYNLTRLVADICNAIGVCVVAGNIRRSSLILIGSVYDDTFLNLKNLELNPERSSIYWMSNNSVRLTHGDDFNRIPFIAERILKNGEPGFINQINMQKFGRYGRYYVPGSKDWTREYEPDHATGFNPCVTGETLIETTKGLLPVRELMNPFMAVVNGKEYICKGFWSNGKKRVYKIRTDHTIIKVTKDHQFNTRNGYISVKELDVGNEVCLSSSYFKENIMYTNIVEIEELCEKEEVFDCEVNEIKCYSSNGLISHNCGEIPLEHREVCNLAEVFPTRCVINDNFNLEIFLQSLKYATFYTSTITLLPTHWVSTNHVIARNRRIGVSLTGIADLYSQIGFTKLTRHCKDGYKVVRKYNCELAKMNGIQPSIRVTTVKPSGTISSMVGVSSGLHHPQFKYAIRRVRISCTSEIVNLLKDAGYYYEKDHYSDQTLVFEFPINQGNTRPVAQVSIWEQFSLLATLSREWADNAVSMTGEFNKETEGAHIEHLLAQYAPVIKSCSLLPHTEMGVYLQMPYEGITKERYYDMVKGIRKIDWSKFGNSDGICPKYCDGDKCEL
jgi:hypothetical protein